MVRIIAGTFRGRRLEAPRGPGVRPTSGRVREAWMNILRDRLAGARVLDLYAGSGALGLEALSRGASTVTFVESGPQALQALQANVARLEVEAQVNVHRGDSLDFVRGLGPNAFDVVLADPPYGGGCATELVRLYRQVPFARILSVEHSSVEHPDGDETRPYGSSALTFCYEP